MAKPPYISTGQAARLLGVTPDAILKWIKRGRLTAVRTAGGHFRVRRDQVEALLESKASGSASRSERKQVPCWEYQASGGRMREECSVCLVYQSRAERCFELCRHPKDTGFTACFAFKGRCNDCPYYREIFRAPVRLLVVTEDASLRERLLSEGTESRFQIEFAANPYDCSSVVERFRPGVVLIDGSLPTEIRSELLRHLTTDSRIPDAKIVQTTPVSRLRGRRVHPTVLEIQQSFTLLELCHRVTTSEEAEPPEDLQASVH